MSSTSPVRVFCGIARFKSGEIKENYIRYIAIANGEMGAATVDSR